MGKTWKKVAVGILLVMWGALMAQILKGTAIASYQSLDDLPATCVSAHDGCNTCARMAGGMRACTLMACQEYGEIRCLAEDDTATHTGTTHTGTAQNKSESSGSGVGVSDFAPGSEGIACTMEYRPVCGQVTVACVQAPCPPVQQTFGNACSLRVAGNATFLYEGECIQAVVSGERLSLSAGERYTYSTVKHVLDKSYTILLFSPVQAANYTQGIIDTVDQKLETSRMKQRMFRRYEKLRRWLTLYKAMLEL